MHTLNPLESDNYHWFFSLFLKPSVRGKIKFKNPIRRDSFTVIWIDVPHGLKNWRNHMFDYGFRILWNGIMIYVSKQDYLELVSKDGENGAIRMLHKLLKSDINLKQQARQRVRPAVKTLRFIYQIRGILTLTSEQLYVSRQNLASEEAKICLSKSSFIIFWDF